jgi:hypothetical protein
MPYSRLDLLFRGPFDAKCGRFDSKCQEDRANEFFDRHAWGAKTAESILPTAPSVYLKYSRTLREKYRLC